MAQGMSDQPDTLFRAALQVARCMAHAEKDDALLAGMRVTVIHTYGDQVVHLLRAAVDNGFRDAPKLNDSAFDPVRQRQDFRVVLARLKSSQRER